MDDTRMNFWTSLAVVATAILLLVFFLWLLDQFIESDFALALLGFAGAIATASFQYRAVKDRETAARLFSEKQKVYTELTETIMDLFHSQGDPARRIAPEESVKRLQSIRTKLIVWGSFDTIRSLDQMGEIGLNEQRTQDPTGGLVWLSRLIAHMRKDLGHKDPKGSVVEIALGLVVPKDRVKIREALKRTN
jgi:hypothetical protein